MKRRPDALLLIVAICLLSRFVFADERPNVLLICIDDLRPELACFGVDYIQSPHIDALAARGCVFTRHYVNAPTCGASRITLLTGRYGSSSNGALFSRAKKMKKSPDGVSPSMPAWFRENGYATVSVGKVSHHPGGRGGKDWDDNEQLEMPESWDRHLLPAGKWQHPRGWMHGLANGEIRGDAKGMDVFQALEGTDSIYPDGPNTEVALEQLDELCADKTKPFFLAFGILRPHLPFGAPAKYLEPYRELELPPIAHPSEPDGKTTWHGSGEFMKYNRWGRDPNTDSEFATEVRRHYAACVTYADAQVGRILEQLNSSPAAENTIVVLWGDHGWHLGEHAIWGKHCLFEEALRSPLIVSPPNQSVGVSTNTVVETVDIFPTLCELAGLPLPDFAIGRSLVPSLGKEAEQASRPAIAYHGKARTIRTDTHRMILHNGGDVELYDHTTPEGETKNVAQEHSEIVGQLTELLLDRLGK